MYACYIWHMHIYDCASVEMWSPEQGTRHPSAFNRNLTFKCLLNWLLYYAVTLVNLLQSNQLQAEFQTLCLLYTILNHRWQSLFEILIFLQIWKPINRTVTCQINIYNLQKKFWEIICSDYIKKFKIFMSAFLIF